MITTYTPCYGLIAFIIIAGVVGIEYIRRRRKYSTMPIDLTPKGLRVGGRKLKGGSGGRFYTFKPVFRDWRH